MRIKTKMLKRLIAVLCAATISSSCMITSVGAVHENEQVDQDNRSNSELQKEIDFWNKCLNNKMASGKAAMELRVRIRQLREQIKKHKKKQIELDKALENLKKEEEKFKKWSKKHNNSKRLVDLIGTIDCNSNAPFKASEADDIINKANKAIAKLQLHMSECEKQEKEEILLEKVVKKRDYINSMKIAVNTLGDSMMPKPKRALIRGALVRLGVYVNSSLYPKKSVVAKIDELKQLKAEIDDTSKKIVHNNSRTNTYLSAVNDLNQKRNKVVELEENTDYKDEASRNKALSELKNTVNNIFEKPVIGDNFTDKNLKHCFKLAFKSIDDCIKVNNYGLIQAQRKIEHLEQVKRDKESKLKKGYDRLKDLESIVETELTELNRRIEKFNESEERRENLLKNKKNGRKANNNYQYNENQNMNNMNYNMNMNFNNNMGMNDEEQNENNLNNNLENDINNLEVEYIDEIQLYGMENDGFDGKNLQIQKATSVNFEKHDNNNGGDNIIINNNIISKDMNFNNNMGMNDDYSNINIDNMNNNNNLNDMNNNNINESGEEGEGDLEEEIRECLDNMNNEEYLKEFEENREDMLKYSENEQIENEENYNNMNNYPLNYMGNNMNMNDMDNNIINNNKSVDMNYYLNPNDMNDGEQQYESNINMNNNIINNNNSVNMNMNNNNMNFSNNSVNMNDMNNNMGNNMNDMDNNIINNNKSVDMNDMDNNIINKDMNFNNNMGMNDDYSNINMNMNNNNNENEEEQVVNYYYKENYNNENENENENNGQGQGEGEQEQQ